nr:MAG TPA: hypothetical protein [Caudoviricetes sp.]
MQQSMRRRMYRMPGRMQRRLHSWMQNRLLTDLHSRVRTDLCRLHKRVRRQLLCNMCR